MAGASISSLSVLTHSAGERLVVMTKDVDSYTVLIHAKRNVSFLPADNDVHQVVNDDLIASV